MTTQTQIKKKLKAIEPATDAVKRKLVCAFLGHSRVVTMCFGYVYCARCEDQIGDTLAGAFDAKHVVISGHDCPTCRANAKTFKWQDRFMLPKEIEVPQCSTS